MGTLALIIPKRTSEKHPSNPIARAQRFLNFGALALGTYLGNRGSDVAIVDEYALAEGADILSEISRLFGTEGPQVIGFSCISAYSADRASWLSNTLHEAFPRAILVAGGQHFAGLWAEGFSEKMPGVTVLVGGEAEVALGVILKLVDNQIPVRKWNAADLPRNVWFSVDGITVQGNQPAKVIDIEEVICSNYSLYPSVKELFPSLEFSRGCAYACVFCANTAENRKNFRRAGDEMLRRGLDGMAEYFQRPQLGFYMQASDFFVNEREARTLSEAFSGAAFQFAWRTEVRVDEISRASLRFLHEAGLRYLDIGLESASVSTLLAMNKTKRPSEYLTSAHDLLEAATELGIFTKVNFLIHPGDTRATVNESFDWLKNNRELISGISSGVTLEYEGTALSRRIASFSSKFGTKRRPHELSRWGVFNLDPSNGLSCEEAQELATHVAQEMQTREAFARSKTFGYLPADLELQSALAELPEADHTTPYS